MAARIARILNGASRACVVGMGRLQGWLEPVVRMHSAAGGLWRLCAGTVASRHTVARADPWQGLRSTTGSTRAQTVGAHLWGYKGQLQM